MLDRKRRLVLLRCRHERLRETEGGILHAGGGSGSAMMLRDYARMAKMMQA